MILTMDEKILVIKYWIEDNKNKIRLWLLCILIATLGFGLGYLTNREFSYAPIIIEKCTDIAK